MGLSGEEQAILRMAAGAQYGHTCFFEPVGPVPARVISQGESLALKDPEAVPRLVRQGLLLPGLGRSIALTPQGRTKATE